MPVSVSVYETKSRHTRLSCGFRRRRMCGEFLRAARQWGVFGLRSRTDSIIRRAGVDAWPRPFHNLRASRQAELSDRHPEHVLADWLGNSVEIARGHYLQTREEHFALALAEETPKAGATAGAVDRETVQKPVPQASARNMQAAAEVEATQGVRAIFPLIPEAYDSVEHARLDSNQQPAD